MDAVLPSGRGLHRVIFGLVGGPLVAFAGASIGAGAGGDGEDWGAALAGAGIGLILGFLLGLASTIDGFVRLARDLREAPPDDNDWVTAWEAMWAVLVTLSALVIVLLATTGLHVVLVVYCAFHLLLIALAVQLRWRCIERHRRPLRATLAD